MNAPGRSILIRGLAAMVAAGALAFGVPAGAGTPATTATDVCASDANPCNVTSVFDVTPGATLDFGTRAVSVTGAGQFNFDIGSGSILCGNFTASTTNPAIDANGAAPLGGTSSGVVSVKARRACSGLNALSQTVPCFDVNDCQIGDCTVRRCSKKTTKVCTGDADCQLGACSQRCRNNISKFCTTNADCGGTDTCTNPTKRCINSPGVSCKTDVDCDYGTCPAQFTCSKKAENPVACSSNSDCFYGTCTVGTASIAMGGAILGNSDNPASITLRAADNVTISKLVNLNSTFVESDAGGLVIDATAGAVVITGVINGNGGGDSQGSSLEILAGTDVTLGEQVDVTGGDFGGGLVDITAGRDITIGRSLLANSTSGGGDGGDLLVDAGRDLSVNGVSALNKTRIETNGHTDAENFAGYGGTQDYVSGRHMAFNLNTLLEGNGSAPDGDGSDMFFDVSGDLTVNGTIRANAGLGKGAGGYIEFLVEGKGNVASNGVIEALGGEAGGGSLEFAATGNVDWAGLGDVSASSGGPGGTAYVDSGASVSMSGKLAVDGLSGGDLEVDACRLTLTGTGKFENKAEVGGDNTLLARESMKLLAGSAVTATAGTNTLEYRTNAKPPLIQGTVTPSPTLVLNPNLLPCPVCGNAEIDGTETCDDGNTTNGDGCSSTCQNEKCLAQTVSPGFPTVPLCEDGDLCTADVCNTSLNGGTCQHPAKVCADAYDCTVDTCNSLNGACVHTPNDSLCNDGNVCTDDICTLSGCGATANSDPCNDSNTCTENDTCANSTCGGSQIPGCGVCGDGQVNPPEQCDDGNATFTNGEYCGVNCVKIPCGKPTNSSGALPKASDALYALKTAVGQTTCSLLVCDVDNSTKVLSSDSLRILRAAVGQPVVLNCPTS